MTVILENNSADVYNTVLWFGISINRFCVGCNWTNYLVCVFAQFMLHHYYTSQLDSLSLRSILPVSYQLHSMVWHKARKLEEIWWFFFTVRILKHNLVTGLRSTQSDPTSFLYKLQNKKIVGFSHFYIIMIILFACKVQLCPSALRTDFNNMLPWWSKIVAFPPLRYHTYYEVQLGPY